MTSVVYTVWFVTWALFAHRKHHVLSAIKEKVTCHG